MGGVRVHLIALIQNENRHTGSQRKQKSNQHNFVKNVIRKVSKGSAQVRSEIADEAITP